MEDITFKWRDVVKLVLGEKIDVGGVSIRLKSAELSDAIAVDDVREACSDILQDFDEEETDEDDDDWHDWSDQDEEEDEDDLDDDPDEESETLEAE